MVDSGDLISNGYVDFYDTYKAMVDAALARPPQAEIQAYWRREGDKAVFDIQVKNLSDVTLSSSTNSAAVHAIVYEDAHVQSTDRLGRAAVETGISQLAPNAAAAFTLETPDLIGVNWERLHFIVLVDYFQDDPEGSFDMLQAAAALPAPAPFTARPETLTWMVDPEDSTVPTAAVNLVGPAALTWTALPGAPWLAVTPSNGGITTQPTISVIKSELSPGWQQGKITFTASEGDLAVQVVVNAYFGSVQRVYLPLAGR